MAGAACRDILKDYRRNVVGMRPNRLCIGGSTSGISAEILSFKIKISWQAQYLVSFKGDFTCPAHWKSPFICHADQ